MQIRYVAPWLAEYDRFGAPQFMDDLGEFRVPKSHGGNMPDVPDVFADF